VCYCRRNNNNTKRLEVWIKCIWIIKWSFIDQSAGVWKFNQALSAVHWTKNGKPKVRTPKVNVSKFLARFWAALNYPHIKHVVECWMWGLWGEVPKNHNNKIDSNGCHARPIIKMSKNMPVKSEFLKVLDWVMLGLDVLLAIDGSMDRWDFLVTVKGTGAQFMQMRP